MQLLKAMTKLSDVRKACHTLQEFAEVAHPSRTHQPAVTLLAQTENLPLLGRMCETMLRGFRDDSQPRDSVLSEALVTPPLVY